MSINDVPVVHPSDESKVPGRIIGRKDVKVFSFKTYLVEERFGKILYVEKGKKYLDKMIAVLKSVALEKESIVSCNETWCKARKYDHYHTTKRQNADYQQ